MNLRVEFPEGSLLIKRTDLKEVIRELVTEVREDILHEEVMTIKDTAEFLKVSIPTVRNIIASNEIPFFQRGQVIRLNRRDVKDWLRKNTIENI